MTNRYTAGRYRGFRYTRQPTGEVMHTDHPRRWAWFAWEPDESDIYIVGTPTKRQMVAIIDHRLNPAEPDGSGASCRKCGRNIHRGDRAAWDERCPADPSGSHNE